MGGTSFTGPSDANTLLTSILQAGAALVAIVAGLLGSRYVAMHGERQAAHRRLVDVQRRLAVARARYEEARGILTDFEVRELLDDLRTYEIIRQAEGLTPDVDVVLSELNRDEGKLPREALQAHLEYLTEQIATAFTAISLLIEHEADYSEPWPTFRRAAGLHPGHDEAWEWAYYYICRELAAIEAQQAAERAKKAAEQARKRYGGLLAPDVLAAVMNAQRPYMPTISPILPTPINDQGWARRRSAVDEAERDVRFLEAEEHAASQHFMDSSQPEGFALALRVLAWLAVTSILAPSAFLAFAHVSLQWPSRLGFILAFLSGVALLLRYLRVYAGYLDGSREALPEWPWNLLRPQPEGRADRILRRARDHARRLTTRRHREPASVDHAET